MASADASFYSKNDTYSSGFSEDSYDNDDDDDESKSVASLSKSSATATPRVQNDVDALPWASPAASARAPARPAAPPAAAAAPTSARSRSSSSPGKYSEASSFSDGYDEIDQAPPPKTAAPAIAPMASASGGNARRAESNASAASAEIGLTSMSGMPRAQPQSDLVQQLPDAPKPPRPPPGMDAPLPADAYTDRGYSEYGDDYEAKVGAHTYKNDIPDHV